MGNLTNPRVIWVKGLLFASVGLLASGLLLTRTPELQSFVLLTITVWAFCRAYYFAFYVIEHYVDPTFRFAGLIDFCRYALLGKRPDRRPNDEDHEGLR